MRPWPLPTPGDIVWCRFPEWPGLRQGPKPRPALVCEVVQREDGAELTVAYGTSQRLQSLHAGEFAITKRGNPAAYNAAGLSFDTKFNLAQMVSLPWTDEFFSVPPHAPHGQQPKLGTLHASMMRVVQAAHRAATTDPR